MGGGQGGQGGTGRGQGGGREGPPAEPEARVRGTGEGAMAQTVPRAQKIPGMEGQGEGKEPRGAGEPAPGGWDSQSSPWKWGFGGQAPPSSHLTGVRVQGPHAVKHGPCTPIVHTTDICAQTREPALCYHQGHHAPQPPPRPSPTSLHAASTATPEGQHPRRKPLPAPPLEARHYL